MRKLSFLIVLAGLIVTATPLLAQTTRTTNAGYAFCLTERALDKAVEIVATGDRQAFAKYIADESNGCGILKAGVKVYVTKGGVFSGKVRLRPEGETFEFWTLREAIT